MILDASLPLLLLGWKRSMPAKHWLWSITNIISFGLQMKTNTPESTTPDPNIGGHVQLSLQKTPTTYQSWQQRFSKNERTMKVACKTFWKCRWQMPEELCQQLLMCNLHHWGNWGKGKKVDLTKLMKIQKFNELIRIHYENKKNIIDNRMITSTFIFYIHM